MIIKPTVLVGSTKTLVGQRTANAKLSAAISAVPNLDLTIKMIEDLSEGAKAIDPPLATRLTDDIHNLLAAGTGVPADIVDRYASAVVAEQSYIKAALDLQSLADALAAERDQLVLGGLSIMCQALDHELKRVYRALRDVRTVPATADQAIDEGRTDDYKQAAALRAEYFEIRQAQRLILTHGLGSDDESFTFISRGWPLVAHASGLGGVWPDLPEWNKYGRKLGKNGQKIKLTPPWPDPDSQQFLDWLLEHPEAGPWVPTFDEAIDLLNEIRSRAQTFYETTRSPDQQALDREYEARQQLWMHRDVVVVERRAG